MNVVWTQTAIDHLAGIFGYIARDSEQYARRMVDRITSRSKQIAAFPQSGEIVPEYGDSAIREVIEGPYRIVYQIETERIAVVAVIHGARLLPESLPDDAR